MLRLISTLVLTVVLSVSNMNDDSAAFMSPHMEMAFENVCEDTIIGVKDFGLMKTIEKHPPNFP